MFGRELAFGACNVKGKLHYLLLGHDLVGLRVRAMHVKKMLKDFKEPRTILDAGCGDGCYSFYLARRFPKSKVHAIDKSRELIEACETIRARLNITNLRFEVQSLIDLSSRGSYDLILCIDVLEHILEDQVALNNIGDTLSDQGILILHVPQRRELNRFVLKPLDEGYVHDHVRNEYTEQEIEDKIERAGLHIQSKRYTFGWPGSLARELYYFFERSSGLPRMFYRTMVFLPSLLLGMQDTVMPNSGHQGFLYRLSRTTHSVDTSHSDKRRGNGQN